jgi:hypothetical protein
MIPFTFVIKETNGKLQVVLLPDDAVAATATCKEIEMANKLVKAMEAVLLKHSKNSSMATGMGATSIIKEQLKRMQA